MESGVRRSAAAATSVAWGVVIGGTFGCLLPFLLGDWHFHRPLPCWIIAEAAGGLLICVGLVPVVLSVTDFTRAEGTPVPVAPPPRLVVSRFYRYVRNPIYVGFLAIMLGQALLFGSRGLLEYTAVAWCIGAAAVRFYEEPTLARRFGAEYRAYRRAVRAWIPRLHPWTPDEPAASAMCRNPDRPVQCRQDGSPCPAPADSRCARSGAAAARPDPAAVHHQEPAARLRARDCGCGHRGRRGPGF